MKEDSIIIRRLEVESRIGVPDEEREHPQKLWITSVLFPAQGFVGLKDQVKNTVDYHEASIVIAEICISRPRHLIETLAVDIAERLLQQYPLNSVEITVEKKILPNADSVAVKIQRTNIR